MNRSLSHYSKEEQRAAKSWWHALPGGQRRYLNQHYKLADCARMVRYYLNNIAPQSQGAQQ